jgi:hypothetical protein
MSTLTGSLIIRTRCRNHVALAKKNWLRICLTYSRPDFACISTYVPINSCVLGM